MKFKRWVFIAVFALAVLLFLLGWWAGSLVDSLRVDVIDEILEQGSLDFESFDVRTQFTEQFGFSTCAELQKRMNYLTSSLYKTGNLLVEYDSKKMSHSDAYKLLKRKHFIDMVRIIVADRESRDKCGSDSNMAVIFFYRTNDENSQRQGYVLDKVVESNSNISVFSFDINFNESAVDSVKQYFNITTAPMLVLDYKTRWEGVHFLPEFTEYYEKNHM